MGNLVSVSLVPDSRDLVSVSLVPDPGEDLVSPAPGPHRVVRGLFAPLQRLVAVLARPTLAQVLQSCWALL